MKLWKKGFAAALAATMTITSMAGCGGNGEKDSSSKSEDGNVKLSMTWWGNRCGMKEHRQRSIIRNSF